MRRIGFLLVSFALLLTGCGSNQVKKDFATSQSQDIEISGPYYLENSSSVTSLAVLQPGGIDLTENEQWVLGFIQNILTNNFTKYSAISVSDRRTINAAMNSKMTADTNLSKAEANRIGGLIKVDYILTGRLRKTSNTGYLFQLAVVDIKTGVQKASYSKETTAVQLRDASAIQAASQELLTQIGVVLTDAGKESLKRVNYAELEGAVALAKSFMSEERGNTIETLNYLYDAVSYDSSLIDAASRLESLSENFASGGLGDRIQNDIDARNFWKKMMDEYETFYTKHPPFELVFTPGPAQKGITDYEAAGGATADIKFNVSFRESPELDSMRKVLKIILNGLEGTKKQELWGFAKWPYSTKLFNSVRDYSFKAELVNDKNTVLKDITFIMPGRLVVYRDSIYPDSQQNRELLFSKIKVDSLTSNPAVRIVSVDGINIGQSGNEGYIRVVPVDNLPRAYPRSLLVYITRNPWGK